MALWKRLLSAVRHLLKGKPRRRAGSRKSRPRKKFRSLRRPVRRVRRAPAKRRPLRRRRAVTRKPKRPAVRKAKKSAAPKSRIPAVKAPKEIFVGNITHYFSRIMVVVVEVKQGRLSVGDTIRVRGGSADFVQKVASLQIESLDVRTAVKGKLAGLKVDREAKPGAKIFKVAG
ncbi:MAG: hypothetical protein Q8Q08_07925 [Candidatus Omnitrophota bacterium]|nr:hypothetical protein [Candidatus Omnitrophota bacterium]MDZ4243103.1 hypothetical protein [Candidatus Omnitrophota bacterium]